MEPALTHPDCLLQAFHVGAKDDVLSIFPLHVFGENSI